MSHDRRAAFRALHHGERPFVLPNAWDHAGGAALAAAGFPAIGTTSLGVAAAAGRPDATGATRAETVALARALARLPVPVTVDIEGGFSDRPDEVAALVAELAGSGVAGINVEDGRPGGTLAPVEHLVAVIRAVRSAAPEVFVNARTDTFWQAAAGAAPLRETLRRAGAYADAGADGLFVPGIAGDDHIRTVAAAVPVPLNVLYLPGRHDLDRLTELCVRRVSCGSLLYRTALHAAVTLAREIRDGTALPDPATPSYAEVAALAR